MKPLLTHYFVCSMCDKKSLTKSEAGACHEGIAEEWTWEEDRQDWYIVPFSDFRRFK